MKLNFKNIFIAVLAVVGLGSCDDFFEKDVYVDIPQHEPKIVVNSLIAAGDTSIVVYVTPSVGIEENKNVSYALADADVEITINGTEYHATYVDVINSDHDYKYGYYYLLDYSPQVGDEIDIVVQHDDYDPVSSQVIVPEQVEISNARFAGKRYDIDGWEYEAIQFHIKDLKGQNNYFELSMLVHNEYTYEEEDTVITYVDEYEVSYLYSPTPMFQSAPNGIMFSDASFKDGEVSLEIWTDNYFYSDEESQEIRLKVKTVSKSYYEYMRLYEIHEWNQYPDLFSGEPVPMYNNIEGGYGILGAMSSVSEKIEN